MPFFESLTEMFSPLVTSLVPYHLLLYSTLLGAELYQSFVMTKLAFITLPRSAFTTLQKKVFRVYFRGQAALVVLTAITLPPHGFLSIANFKSDWVPFLVAGVTSVLNLVIYEPRTRKAMIDRIHQETRNTSVPPGEENHVPSEEMERLNRTFSRNHAMTIHLNLISMGAMLFYGLRLASQVRLDQV